MLGVFVGERVPEEVLVLLGLFVGVPDLVIVPLRVEVILCVLEDVIEAV